MTAGNGRQALDGGAEAPAGAVPGAHCVRRNH